MTAEQDLDTPAEPATRSPQDIERSLEAILVVADEPQSLVSLATALNAPVPAVRQAIERLVADYDGRAGGPRRGFELREVGGGWRLYVRADHDELVRDFVLTQNPSRLSQAALETLAVIAYKQPISRGSIASIRAVNVDSVVRTLLGRGLITEAFTDSETGAIHYADHGSAAHPARHQLARRTAADLAPARRRSRGLRRRLQQPVAIRG